MRRTLDAVQESAAAMTALLCLPCARQIMSGGIKDQDCPKCRDLRISPLRVRASQAAEVLMCRELARRTAAGPDRIKGKPNMGPACGLHPDTRARKKKP